jgi:hypothetical protein
MTAVDPKPDYVDPIPTTAIHIDLRRSHIELRRSHTVGSSIEYGIQASTLHAAAVSRRRITSYSDDSRRSRRSLPHYVHGGDWLAQPSVPHVIIMAAPVATILSLSESINPCRLHRIDFKTQCGDGKYAGGVSSSVRGASVLRTDFHEFSRADLSAWERAASALLANSTPRQVRGTMGDRWVRCWA